MIIMIAAAAENNALGKDNKIVWHLPIVVDTMQKALDACPKEEDSFIIGGGEIYKIGISYADKIELTRVHGTFEADAFFPEINGEEWKLDKSELNEKDESHNYEYSYQTFVRK